MSRLKDTLSSEEFSIIWNAIRRFIEALQILSLIIIPQFKWPSSLIDTFAYISWIVIDVSDTAYTVILIFVCSIITLYIVGTIVGFFCDLAEECCECLDCCCACDDDMCEEYFWWYIGDTLLFGIFAIPIASTLLEIFHCQDGYVFKDDSIECGQAEHVLLCIWSAITLIILIICICLRSNSHDIMQHRVSLPTKLREDVHYFDAYYSCFRLLAMIMAIIVAESSPIIASLCLFLVFLIPNAFTIKKLPYVHMKFNYIRCSMDAFNLWSAFALFIVAIVDDDQSWAGFIVWCLFPFCIIGCCVLCKMQLKNRPLSAQDLRTAEDEKNGRVNPYNHDFDEYFKGNDELMQLLTEKDKCLMMKPYDTNSFIEYLSSQKINDFHCIIGCNQAGNAREDEAMKKWNDEQINTFCNLIKECNQLVLFRLNGWIFQNEQLQKIVSALCITAIHDLKVLDFGGNCLGVDDAKIILNAINVECFPNLKEISFVGNYVNYKIWREELIDVHPLGGLVII